MEIYKLKHDLKSVIFKVKSSLEIFSDIDDEDLKEVSEIALSSVDYLDLLVDIICILDKLEKNLYDFRLIPVKKLELENLTIVEPTKLDEALLKYVGFSTKHINVKRINVYSDKVEIFSRNMHKELDKFLLYFIRTAFEKMGFSVEVLNG